MLTDRLPPIRLFAVFEAIIRTGSPSRAAEELNVSQPAVSQAIKALEAHIGASLLDRSTRPPTLTEAGRILQRGVTDSFAAITNVMAEIKALTNVSQQSVTIACSVGTATYWLMPRLTEFYSDHDHLSINVMTTGQGTPTFGAGVDLAIRYGLGQWTDGQVIKLTEETVVPVCSPALANRLKSQSMDMTQVPLLHVNAGDDSWLGWRGYLRLAGLAETRAPGRNFTNYVQATQAALDGQGIMLGWNSNTADLLSRGLLVALPFPVVKPKEAFYLVASPLSHSKPAAQILATWLTSSTQSSENNPPQLG
jgi:LysR family transcriptional regulator, glycine cleavage system transcriptional activator